MCLNGLFLKSIRTINTKESSTQTTKSLIASNPNDPNGNISEFISPNSNVETFEPELPKYNYSTQEIPSQTNNKLKIKN